MFSRDFNENEILKKCPNLLDILLFDYTTKKNIIWATDNYKKKGALYSYNKSITSNLITGRYSNIIKPRVDKSKTEQAKRSKDKQIIITL